jgi:hypothetical protein
LNSVPRIPLVAAIWLRSAARVPSKVLKKTMKKTTSQAVAIFDRSPSPKISMTSGSQRHDGGDLHHDDRQHGVGPLVQALQSYLPRWQPQFEKSV